MTRRAQALGFLATLLIGCLPYGKVEPAQLSKVLPDRYGAQSVAVSDHGPSAADAVRTEIAATDAGQPKQSTVQVTAATGVDAPVADSTQGARDARSSEAAAASPAPEGSAQRAILAQRTAHDRWWTSFADPALDGLIEEALRENLDLRVAWARVQQARALAMQAAATRYPQVGAAAEASWTRSPFAFAGTSADQTLLRASAPVSYEVDWFARNAGRAEAAKLDLAAARGDAEAAAITVAAQVAESWFDVVEARARIALLGEQSSINERFLELTTLRFRQGLTSVIDAHQQRQQVAATEAQAALAEASERVSENQLAVMLGRSPDARRFAADRTLLPALPAAPDEGLPMDLLLQRPDVRAATRRVEAADERVAVAVASRLPTLTLNGSPGYQWTRFELPNAPSGTTSMNGAPTPRFGGDTHGPAYSLGAALNIPLFDGFLRRAEVDLSRARTREAIDNHARVLLRAVSEVDSALLSERTQQSHLRALDARLAAAEDALESARERYRQGISDFLPVLQALGAVQQTQLALLAARRQQLSLRVQLHRALGGTWVRAASAGQSGIQARERSR